MRAIPPVLNQRRRWILLRLVGNGFLQAIATVSNALLVEITFDRLLTRTNPQFYPLIGYIGFGLVAGTVLMAWLRVVERIDAEQIGQSYIYDVRMLLYNRLVTLAPRALQSRTQGGVMLRFVGDLTSLRQWVSLGVARVTVALTTTVAALTALAIVDWHLALAAASVLFIGSVSSLKVGERMQAAAQDTRQHLNRLAGNINEQVAAIAVVQVFGQSRREKKRLARQSRRLEKAMVHKARVAGQLTGITQAITALSTTVVLLVGTFGVAAGRTKPGTVIAAMTIVGLLVPRLQDLGRVQEYWHNSRVSLEKIQDFLHTPSHLAELPDAPDLVPGAGLLEFAGVSVEGALQDIRAIAQPGQVVAIVGPNGAGKSTLLAVAARLIDPDEGTIRLDGQDLATHSLASVRRAIGMATLDLPLLRGSVSKNLRYRDRNASPEELERVWHLCGIDEVMAELPNGDKTRIAEGGKGLSAGQRQRIALARAILGNPPLLLLDEVDANLDAQATAVVDRILTGHHGTVLIVTHRRERLVAADVIWHLENGRLVEVGPATALLNRDGPTSRLFQSQAESLPDAPVENGAIAGDLELPAV